MTVKVYLHRDCDAEGLADETGIDRETEKFDALWAFLDEVELYLEWDDNIKEWKPVSFNSTNI